MDTIEALKQDLKAGRISAERLVDLVADLCRKLEAANRRIEDLEKQCGGTAKVDEPFSTRAEERSCIFCAHGGASRDSLKSASALRVSGDGNAGGTPPWGSTIGAICAVVVHSC